MFIVLIGGMVWCYIFQIVATIIYLNEYKSDSKYVSKKQFLWYLLVPYIPYIIVLIKKINKIGKE